MFNKRIASLAFIGLLILTGCRTMEEAKSESTPSATPSPTAPACPQPPKGINANYKGIGQIYGQALGSVASFGASNTDPKDCVEVVHVEVTIPGTTAGQPDAYGEYASDKNYNKADGDGDSLEIELGAHMNNPKVLQEPLSFSDQDGWSMVRTVQCTGQPDGTTLCTVGTTGKYLFDITSAVTHVNKLTIVVVKVLFYRS